MARLLKEPKPMSPAEIQALLAMKVNFSAFPIIPEMKIPNAKASCLVYKNMELLIRLESNDNDQMLYKLCNYLRNKVLKPTKNANRHKKPR